jgi:hypothetical protein
MYCHLHLNIQVNGTEVKTGSTLGGTRVSYNGRFIRLEYGQVIVEFDGNYTVIIKVGPYYKNKLEGICGNYDGDPVYTELYEQGSDVPAAGHGDVVKSWFAAFPGMHYK